jgi:photosystem II stability/assembly factor-like uncharacterized protein
MRTTYTSIPASMLFLLLSACGGGGGSDGSGVATMAALAAAGNSTAVSGSTGTGTSTSAGIKTLVSVNAEALGANCANGGVRIEAGPDSDGNGVLAAGEVGSIQYVCHGAAGASGGPGATGLAGAAGSNGLSTLVQMRDEASGANCAAGGKAIDAGVDGNASGLLEPAEISSTGYVCNGSAGANGSNGADGVDGTSGTNGTNGAGGANGTDGTDGSNGLNTLVNIVREDAGVNCVHGGSKVETGLDGNRSGVLDVGEVSTTNYICNGAPGATLAWVDVTGTAVQAQSSTGYLARNDTAEVVVTLPPNPAIGDVVQVTGAGMGGWKIAQNANQAIYTTNVGGMAGANWTAHEPSGFWFSVASSADGRKLVAIGSNTMYTSIDGGATWTPRASRQWSWVASSADGSNLVALEHKGAIYTSTDSGANWTAHDVGANQQWLRAASSADGSRLVAATVPRDRADDPSEGKIYTSTDRGGTWTERNITGAWQSVTSSADGMKLAATDAASHRIYLSTDGGASWTPRGPNQPWIAIASSADGNRLVAAANGGQLYTSTDGGENWTAREFNRNWWALASSADGKRLVAIGDYELIYTSSDGGLNWVAHDSSGQFGNQSRGTVAMSADGGRIVAPVFDGQIYTSISTTTLGTSGSIKGTSIDAIELQYVGGGMFTVLSHEGSLTIQ